MLARTQLVGGIAQRPRVAQPVPGYHIRASLRGRLQAAFLMMHDARRLKPGQRERIVTPLEVPINSYDVIIAGGGVIGSAVARALLIRQPSLKVLLIEKENRLAAHQSSRNSGVVHVGYNQKPGTLKARLVVEGSRRLRAFCRETGVPLFEGGILVVARTQGEVETIQILCERGQANGARVRMIDREELARREPHATGIAALEAPEGASFDAHAYVQALANQARSMGTIVQFSEAAIGLEEKPGWVEVHARAPGELAFHAYQARVFINAAGLHADRLAWKMGCGCRYLVVPFRGYYSELAPDRRFLVNSHLYACPDLNFPFLGVHLSRNFDGRVRVGPGAMLALGREAYRLTDVHLADCREMLLFPGFWRMAVSPTFLRLLRQEWKKSFFRSAVAAEARMLVPELRTKDLRPSDSGIRAQLVSEDGKLVDDLVVEDTPRSIHILNAVSPALTCSLPFADILARQAVEKLGG